LIACIVSKANNEMGVDIIKSKQDSSNNNFLFI